MLVTLMYLLPSDSSSFAPHQILRPSLVLIVKPQFLNENKTNKKKKERRYFPFFEDFPPDTFLLHIYKQPENCAFKHKVKQRMRRIEKIILT